MARVLLSGNEAIARAAWEAGASFGVGYPGTPSTEVLESFSRFEAVRAEWAPNEKVALEVAAGVSLGGARVLCTMKHVGMNVAADALMTLAYTGVGGGLVILVADDPGMHSSQNEQDSRRWGPFAKVPILEPSDTADAYSFTKAAFDLSERFDTPVIVRSTVRVSHAKGLVEVAEREARRVAGYEKAARKWVMMPGNARLRRVQVSERTDSLVQWAETTDMTRDEAGGPDATFGVVTAGVSFEYVREVLPEAPVLKLAASWPLPPARVRAFAERVGRVAVVEELDPYLRESLLALGIDVMAEETGRTGELDPGRVRAAFGLPAPETRQRFDDLPPRPPMLCPGCPHRGVFAALRDMEAVVVGDIGCYTLGSLPPLSAMDTCVCMGASIGMGYGLGRTGSAGDRPVVSVIGDSTFSHSGLTGLLHEVYNGGDATVVILDNRTTAMTGHQGNPISGITLSGEEAPALDLVAVCTALGASNVVKLNPLNLKRTRKVLEEETARPGVSVIIAESPCVLLTKKPTETTFAVDLEACTSCDLCVNLGCPAIAKDQTSLKAVIDPALCIGCTQCIQVCRYRAIKTAGPACATVEVWLVSPVTTVLLTGVGGQGTILAGDVLARTAAAAGHDVKLSEVHGMSQRGGSVDTTVRFGERVYAPIVQAGEVDHLVAFEIIEAARWVHYLRPGSGTLLVNRRAIQPLPVLTGAMGEPIGLVTALDYEGAVFLDAEDVACEVGSPRSANIVLMGALSTSLPIPVEAWRSVIEGRVPPKTVEANLAAFERGREAVSARA